ncbi:phospholipase D1-like isoform X3 [Styela clava]
MAQDRVNARARNRPSFDRLDTVMSDDGEGYEVLPLPSPGMEEPDSPTYPSTTSAFAIKPRVPYMSIYSSPSRLFAGLNSGFLSGTPITLKFIEASRDNALHHPLNPYLYTIEVSHGPFTWIVHKRFKHLRELHDKLWAHRTSLKIPLPSKSHKEKRKTVKVDKRKGEAEIKLPRFPKRPDMWVSPEQITKRKEHLELYVNSLLKSTMYKKHSSMKKFLEVSRFSFIQDLGTKGKEGTLRKKSGGHTINLYFCDKCCNVKCRELLKKWSDRWFVVKDTFIMYLSPDQSTIKGVLLFDNQLKVDTKEHSKRLTISNASRKLTVNCWTERQTNVWKDAILTTANECASDFVGKNQNGSFAPVRENSPAHWFVDGSSYFNAVADAIEDANEEIFITDWWLSPQIYLKRPISDGGKWQLDKLLKRKADAGVKIYILLYKEVEMAVALQSRYAKDILQNSNLKNIRVLRHPDHITTTKDSLLWAHHEKIVIIDQKIAFVGGIDLCYGRWDNHEHRLTDMGSDKDRMLSVADVTDSQNPSNEQTKSSAHTTSALLMFQAMTVAVVEEVSKEKTEDSELQLKPLSTSSSDDGTFQAVDDEPDNRIAHDNDMNMTSNGKTTITVIQESSTLLSSNGADGGPASSAGAAYKGMVENMKLAGQAKLWVGKDYANFVAKDLAHLDDPYDDMIDRLKMPRMPWHDIACVTYGKAARDAARHFIQRWNFTKIEKAKKGESVPFLLPKAYCEDAFNLRQSSIHPDAVNAKVQILRSSAEWSAGISEAEQSIQTAYIDAINKAEHYIYIENQFFISVRNNPEIKNNIVDALFYRIMRAHTEKKNFRVYIVMPLIPGFEGDISDSSKSLAIQAVLDWQYRSMNRGDGSLMGDLTKQGVNCSNYVSFCGLRTHSELENKPITEIIYVHSKMLIVDDRYVIIGSANINDRSMTGSRDSEVAMLIEDTEMIDSTMDGKSFQVGRFASRLRKRVFAEHLGLLPEELVESNFEPTENIDDIACDKFFKDVWFRIAGINTNVYEKVFKCVPSDIVAKFSDIANFQSHQMKNVDQMKEELEKIQGYLVLLPLFFLKDEPLRPEGLTKESMAPTALWT